MEPIEKLKARLVVLEKQVTEERRKDEEKEQAINSNPEMVKIIKDRTEKRKKIDEIRKKSDKLELKIKEQFLIENVYHSHIDFHTAPQFQHKTSNWGQTTNINDTVLFHIDCQSPLHLLTNDDVKDAVSRLIDKAIEQCPELVNLNNELRRLSLIERVLYDKERETDKKLRAQFTSESKVHILQEEINEITFKIGHPKKAAEQEKRDTKRNEARNNLCNPAVIDAIYSKLKIKIPKNEN